MLRALQQVDTSLKEAGTSMAGLRAAREQNPVLQELAITPLWLSVLILAYGLTAVVPALTIPNVASRQDSHPAFPATRPSSHPFHSGVLVVSLSTTPRRFQGVSLESPGKGALVLSECSV